jgi:hypothetical protein
MNIFGSHPNDENQEDWTKGMVPRREAPSWAAAVHRKRGFGGSSPHHLFSLIFMGNH